MKDIRIAGTFNFSAMETAPKAFGWYMTKSGLKSAPGKNHGSIALFFESFAQNNEGLNISTRSKCIYKNLYPIDGQVLFKGKIFILYYQIISKSYAI